MDQVTDVGLREVRKIPGYHDEPLKGQRFGQRSIRLSKAYRAIYKIDRSGEIHFIEVIEVNKHEYTELTSYKTFCLGCRIVSPNGYPNVFLNCRAIRFRLWRCHCEITNN